MYFVSYSEIESEERLFGDNDMLLAVVEVLCQASKLISTIDCIDEKLYESAGGSGSSHGRGGMITKLQAATLAVNQGIDTIITNGKHPEKIYDILEGKKVGTKFIGNKNNF